MRELAAGRLSTGHNVKVGYLSQHAEELGAGGPEGQSVVEAAQRATGLSPGKARALLGRFLFSGEDADKPLSGLSGGERRRLSLAVLVQSGANVLILDEPTNHLDIESREALEDALRAFTGAILLVSHDRALLDAVGTRTIAVEDGALHSYEGGWPEYVRVRDERRAGGVGKSVAPMARPAGLGGGQRQRRGGREQAARRRAPRRRARPRTASATRRRPSAPSRRPRRRCASSNRSSRIPRPGPPAMRRPSPKPATRRRSAPSMRPMRALRR